KEKSRNGDDMRTLTRPLETIPAPLAFTTSLYRRGLVLLAAIVVAVGCAVIINAGPASADPPHRVLAGVTIFSPVSGRCLDADLSGNATRVQLWDCNGWLNQNWDFYSDGTIRNGSSGRCLDADRTTGGADGSLVQLGDCNGLSSQVWNTSLPALTGSNTA